MKPDVFRAELRAMSTTIEVTGVGVTAATVDAAARYGRQLAEAWERTFSRFRTDSELSRLNAAQGEPLHVSARLISVLRRAARAVRDTEGRFDPRILSALEAVGYDRDIAAVRAGPPSVVRETTRPLADVTGWIEIDEECQIVRLAPSLGIDLGGIAKGAYVDQLAAALSGWPGGCVGAGGDLVVWGEPPSGPHWVVGVEDPAAPEQDRLVVEVNRSAAAFATSGTHRRRWTTDRGEMHHLIDPQSGLPLGGRVRAVTAIAPAVVEAEVATKALMVAAARGEPLSAFGSELAIVVSDGGETAVIGRIDEDAYTLHTLQPARRPA